MAAGDADPFLVRQCARYRDKDRRERDRRQYGLAQCRRPGQAIEDARLFVASPNSRIGQNGADGLSMVRQREEFDTERGLGPTRLKGPERGERIGGDGDLLELCDLTVGHPPVQTDEKVIGHRIVVVNRRPVDTKLLGNPAGGDRGIALVDHEPFGRVEDQFFRSLRIAADPFGLGRFQGSSFAVMWPGAACRTVPLTAIHALTKHKFSRGVSLGEG